jgi:drug/metabolite transporter (DMT)-like permease
VTATAAGINAPLKSWLPNLLISALFWGTSFFFIKVALEAFTPAQVGLGRLLVGGVVLWLIVWITRQSARFTVRDLLALLAVGAGLSGFAFILIPMAEQHITSVLAGLLNASTPLWTALFVGLLVPHEKSSAAQWGGLLVGALGIAILLGAWQVDSFPLQGAALMLAATACYGIGGALSRILLKRINQPTTSIAAAQISLSSLIVLPFVIAGPPVSSADISWSSTALWGLVALGVLGTGFAYIFFWRVISVAGATNASMVTYIVPIISTLLGVVILREHLHWYEPVGAVVVLVGVWFAQRKPRAPKAALPAETV